jgi:biopolymer transport protein ExbB/TolQ
MQQRKQVEAAFSVPLIQVTTLGSLLCGTLYSAIQLRLVAHPILVRYALCHWVAIASVWLFCIAMVALATKIWVAMRQLRATEEGTAILQSIVDARHDLEPSVRSDAVAMIQWLDTLWQTQKVNVLQSWLGQRVADFLTRQVKRRNAKQMDEDLRDLADQGHDAQHASHGMIRIICWAMPMLGFLGTVLGISDTLGHMDAQALASGSQDAMNSLTSGLYVAFDTTAVGLILTMIAMFVQFAVQRAEMRVIHRIDASVANAMHESLSSPDVRSDTADIQASLRAVANGLLESMQQLIQKQSELWRSTIDEAHQHWTRLSDGTTETAKSILLPSLRESLQEYRESMRVQSEELVRLQAEGAQQIDARLQQWQITISEQARASLRQQQEISRHTEQLTKLLDSTQLISALQTPIESTLNRLTDIDRFHDAAICLTEAVAFLGSQMERHGILGRQPVRRRAPDRHAVPLQVVNPDEPSDDAERVHAPSLAERTPSFGKRRAG